MQTTEEHISEINSLIALAVKDAVLTPVERKTIVAKGVEYGMEEADINGLLDRALRERIAQAPKSSLKSCPDCGAQIPLISEFCPYCGHDYKTEASAATDTYSEAAKIIEAENIRVEEERFAKQENCPKCGNPYPLISNVCPYCGNVLFHSDSHELSAKNLSDNIRREIANIENLPKISVGMFLKYRITWVLMFFGILMFLFFVDYSPLISISSFLVLMFAGLPFARMKKIDEKNGKGLMDEYNDQYQGFLSKIKLFENQIDNFYGENAEARSLLQELRTQLDESTKALADSRKRSYRIIFTMLAVAIVLSIVLPRPVPVPYTLRDNVKEYPIDWQLIDSYKVIRNNQPTGLDDKAWQYFKLDSLAVVSVGYWQDYTTDYEFDDDSDDDFCFIIKDLSVSFVADSGIDFYQSEFWIQGCDADGNAVADFYVRDWDLLKTLSPNNRGPIKVNVSTDYYGRLNHEGNNQIQDILNAFNSISTYRLIFKN